MYCSSSVYVVPSWVEGSQLPPMEAMACGCAVVATGVGGIVDYAVPEVTALVSSPMNPEALAFNIARLLGDEKLLKEIAVAGRKHIEQFTWAKATELLEAALAC